MKFKSSMLITSLLLACSSGQSLGASSGSSGGAVASLSAIHDGLAIRKQSTDFTTMAGVRPATTDERQVWVDLLRGVLRLAAQPGHQKISWMDFDKISTDLELVKIFINTSDQAIVGSGSRTGSVYLTESKTVILNYSLLGQIKNNPGSAIMSIHEFLGAMGYPDENFAISSFVYLRVQRENIQESAISNAEDSLKAFLDQNLLRQTNIAFDTRAANGVSGVGGGGDPFIGEIKSMLIRSWASAEGVQPDERPIVMDLLVPLRLEPASLSGSYQKLLRTPYQGILLGLLQNDVVIVVDTDYWDQIRGDEGTSHIRERSQFVMNLVQTVLTLNHLQDMVEINE